MNVEGLLAIASNSEPSKGYLYLIIIIPIVHHCASGHDRRNATSPFHYLDRSAQRKGSSESSAESCEGDWRIRGGIEREGGWWREADYAGETW